MLVIQFALMETEGSSCTKSSLVLTLGYLTIYPTSWSATCPLTFTIIEYRGTNSCNVPQKNPLKHMFPLAALHHNITQIDKMTKLIIFIKQTGSTPSKNITLIFIVMSHKTFISAFPFSGFMVITGKTLFKNISQVMKNVKFRLPNNLIISSHISFNVTLLLN